MKSSRKKLSELSSTDIEEIDFFLERNFCTVFHEIEFNRIAAEVFRTDFSYQLVYNNHGKLIAICPLHSLHDGLLKKTYSNPAIFDIRYGGWIYNREEISLVELLEQLRPAAKEALTYWSIPQVEGDDYSAVGKKKEFGTPIIDLTLSLEEILHQCVSRKRRQSIRSAHRKGVVVEELNFDSLTIFIEQSSYLKQSVGFNPFPSAYFTKLYEHYYAKKQIAAFASRFEGDYLASGLIIGNKHMAHLWVAGKPRETNVSVPRQDLLVWETIKWAKEQAYRYYDLCYIDQEKQQDIARFKLGFSKVIVPFYLYTAKNLFYRIAARFNKYFESKCV